MIAPFKLDFIQSSSKAPDLGFFSCNLSSIIINFFLMCKWGGGMVVEFVL